MSTSTLAIEGGLISVPDPGKNGVRAFKGLPFSAPPVGPLRWHTPAPVTSWRGVRSTEAFGMNAMQGSVFSDIDSSTPGISEDCLYLNIWTPARPESNDRLPVMFWIHGGGFAAGHGGEPRYDGSQLASRGIIVITVNYRLGAFGFLAHPQLSAENLHGASGNWGLLDLIAALKWTKRNIAAFGGDAGAVTIAGESAGAAAVSALMASPLAKDLFARAIGQSGAFFSSPSRKLKFRQEAEQEATAWGAKVGMSSSADLRSLSAEAVLASTSGLSFRPIIDGFVLPATPAELFAARRHCDVPLLAGWNKDEGFNLGLVGIDPDEGMETVARTLFGASAADVLRHYPTGDVATIRASMRALAGDAGVIHSTWSWIEAQKAYGVADIYRFRFERAPLTNDGWFGDKPSGEAGAFHSGEIPYVFDTLDAMPWLIDAADREIARVASSWWVNFVKFGTPNGAGVKEWPSYRTSGAPVMHVDAVALVSQAKDDVHRIFAQQR